MTFRAVRILREVDRIACEDTRVTRVLCEQYGIETPLLRHEAHNEAASTEGLVELLRQGRSVALVTDAGTPAISDPGQRLVAAALAAGFEVVPVPGASAVTTALSVAGLPTDRFVFHGFAPKKPGERVSLLSSLTVGTHVFFCPARDLPDILADVAEALPDAPTVVARELTKRHESWYRGTARELSRQITEGLKGEAVLLVHRAASDGEVSDRDIAQALLPLLGGGVRKKEAAQEIADRLGVSRRRVYQIAIRIDGET